MEILLLLCTLASATVYFQEEFNADWDTRWVPSKGPGGEFLGRVERSAGEYYVDANQDAGLHWREDFGFAAVSAVFQPFSNKDKDLVVQFTVRFEEKPQCGGGIIRLMKPGFDQRTLDNSTPIFLRFGPYLCGKEKRTLVEFQYEETRAESKKRLIVETDQLTHQYTVIISPDSKVKVLLDDFKISYVKLDDNWAIRPPKKIRDESATKPEDWDDRRVIYDPEDFKPADWDKEPEYITDPDSVKPADWDNAEDGSWEPSLKRNPNYRGIWRPRTIENPNYKGPWQKPLIDNPKYREDPYMYASEIGGVAVIFDEPVPSVIIDNIFIGDSVKEAEAFSKKVFQGKKEAEEKSYKEYQERKKKEEEERAEAVKSGPELISERDIEEDKGNVTEEPRVEL